MLIVSIDSSLGSRLLVCEATGPAAHAPVRLEVLTNAEQADRLVLLVSQASLRFHRLLQT